MTKEIMKQALNVLLLVEAEMNCEYGVTESLRQAIAEAEKQEQGELNYDYVICPKCVHQFRAIPENVQRLMIDAGFEPPFNTPQTKEWVSLTEEDDIDWEEGDTLRDLFKAIENKLKEKNT